MNEKQSGLSGKVDAAFQATATTVIERAKQTNTPVVVWEDGHVREIPSEQLEENTERSSSNRPAL